MRKSILLLLLAANCTINNPVAYIEVPTNTGSPIQSTPQPTVPDAPLNILMTSGNSQLTISWDASLNATSYNLYCQNSPGANKLSAQTLDVISPYIYSAINGTKYYCVVTAIGNGLESVESLESSAYAGIIDNHDGSVFIAHLNQTWQKCSDNYYNAVTDSCDVAGIPVHVYCAANNNSCDNGVKLVSGDVFDTCAMLAINGGGWRVPTVVELQAFYPYHHASIVQDWHWSTDAIPFKEVSMWDGTNKIPIFRTNPGYVVCVK